MKKNLREKLKQKLGRIIKRKASKKYPSKQEKQIRVKALLETEASAFLN